MFKESFNGQSRLVFTNARHSTGCCSKSAVTQSVKNLPTFMKLEGSLPSYKRPTVKLTLNQRDLANILCVQTSCVLCFL